MEAAIADDLEPFFPGEDPIPLGQGLPDGQVLIVRVHVEEPPVEIPIHDEALEHLEEGVDAEVWLPIPEAALDGELPVVEPLVVLLDPGAIHHCPPGRPWIVEPPRQACEPPAPDVVAGDASIRGPLEGSPS